MTLPVRLSLGVILASLGAAVAVPLGWVVLNPGTTAGEEVMLYLLVAGLSAAVVGGGVAFLQGRSLSKKIRSLAITDTESEAGWRTPRSNEIGRLGAYVHEIAGAIRTKETLLQQAEEELRDVREQLRGVSMYLESAREGERKRIARDIHDDLGQALSALKLDLSLLRDELSDPPRRVQERIEGMTTLVGASIRSVKRIISELRPQVLDDLGLTAAIEWQAEEFQKRTGIPVELSIYPQEILLETDQSTALFRIFQETLANVARHSGARSVRASLTEIDGVVELDVHDDGCGIRPRTD